MMNTFTQKMCGWARKRRVCKREKKKLSRNERAAVNLTFFVVTVVVVVDVLSLAPSLTSRTWASRYSHHATSTALFLLSVLLQFFSFIGCLPPLRPLFVCLFVCLFLCSVLLFLCGILPFRKHTHKTHMCLFQLIIKHTEYSCHLSTEHHHHQHQHQKQTKDKLLLSEQCIPLIFSESLFFFLSNFSSWSHPCLFIHQQA